HLVTGNQPGNRTIANSNQEAFGTNRRQPKNAPDGIVKIDLCGVEYRLGKRGPGNAPMHSRWFSEKHFHRQVYRLVVEIGVAQFQMMSFGRLADNRVWAPLAA